MSIFSNIFHKKGDKAKTEVFEISIDALPKTIDEAFSSKIKETDSLIKKDLSNIGSDLKNLSSTLKNLKETHLDESNPRAERIVSTAKESLLTKFSSLAEKTKPIDFSSIKTDLDKLNSYLVLSMSAFNRDITSFRKNIAYTKYLMPSEMKTIGRLIEKISGSFEDLSTALNNEDLKRYFSLQQKSSGLSLLIKKILDAETGLEKNSQDSQEAEKRKKELLKQLDLLASAQETVELKELNSKKDELNAAIENSSKILKDSFYSINMPLEKFSKLLKTRKYLLSKDQEAALQNYLQNPLCSLLNDSGLENLKMLFNEIKKAIAEGKLSLKDKELEKAKNILSNFSFFSIAEKIEAHANSVMRLKAVEEKISKNTAEKNLQNLKDSISNSENSLLRLSETKTILNASKDSMIAQSKNLVKELEDIFSETGGKIRVTAALLNRE